MVGWNILQSLEGNSWSFDGGEGLLEASSDQLSACMRYHSFSEELRAFFECTESCIVSTEPRGSFREARNLPSNRDNVVTCWVRVREISQLREKPGTPRRVGMSSPFREICGALWTGISELFGGNHDPLSADGGSDERNIAAFRTNCPTPWGGNDVAAFQKNGLTCRGIVISSAFGEICGPSGEGIWSPL